MELLISIFIGIIRWISNGLLVSLLGIGVYVLFKKRTLNDLAVDKLFHWSVKIFLVYSIIVSLDSASFFVAMNAFGGKASSTRTLFVALLLFLFSILPAVMIFLERNRNVSRVRRWAWFALVLEVAGYVFSIFQSGFFFNGVLSELVTIAAIMPPVVLLLLVRKKIQNSAPVVTKVASAL